MFHWIRKLLDREALDELAGLFEVASFSSGRLTAKGHAQAVKRNEQMDDSAQKTRAAEIIAEAVAHNDHFQNVVIPHRISRPAFSRYGAGMEYGLHVDSAFSGSQQDAVRRDVSVTVFLSDPATYQGGELVVCTSLNDQMFKLPRGDALVYPTSALHRVARVEAGQRLAAVLWVESRIRDGRKREILADVERVRRRVATLDPEGLEADLAQKVHSNLMRLWDGD